jgi:nitrogenase subunit NifH
VRGDGSEELRQRMAERVHTAWAALVQDIEVTLKTVRGRTPEESLEEFYRALAEEAAEDEARAAEWEDRRRTAAPMVLEREVVQRQQMEKNWPEDYRRRRPGWRPPKR